MAKQTRTTQRSSLSQWLSNMFASLWYGDAATVLPTTHPTVVQRWNRTPGFQPVLITRNQRIYC